MSTAPRDVGPIEGREVPRVEESASESFGPRTGLGAQSAEAFMATMREIRNSRGRSVPNSRPVPEWVQRYAWVLDSAFPVPGLAGRRVGVDGLIALIPGIGDAVGIGLSMSVVLAAVGAGVSIPTLIRMLGNVALEALAGVIPFGGALFDLAYKSNMRNVTLMERDLLDHKATRRSSLGVLLLSAGLVVASFVMLIVSWILAFIVLWWVLAKIF